jgi:hypothetical protein
MSGNILDIDGISKMFGVDNFNETVEVNTRTGLQCKNSETLTEISTPEDPDFDKQLKDLMVNANNVMSAANYLISSTPDAESIAAAASLLSSINGIISEFRKSNQMRKRFEYQKRLEEIKIEARERMFEKKIEADKEKIKIGDGNTINIQNNMIPFSQEKIVEIIESRKLIQAVS